MVRFESEQAYATIILHSSIILDKSDFSTKTPLSGEGTQRVKTTAKIIDMRAKIECRTKNYKSRSPENQRTALRFPFCILSSLFIIRYSAFLRKINQANIYFRESSCGFVDKT
jgi:hypothetical protein